MTGSVAGTGGTDDAGGSGGATGGVGGSGGSGNAGSAGSGTAGVGGSAGSSAGSAGTSPFEGDAGIGNLLSDPSFEQGLSGWVAFGASTLEVSETFARTGTQSLRSSGRTQPYEGPSLRMESMVFAGLDYAFEVWVRTEAGTHTFNATLKTRCAGQTDDEAAYNQIANRSIGESWAYLNGSFTAPSDCTLAELRVYIEGPAAGESFFIDDAGLYAQ